MDNTRLVRFVVFQNVLDWREPIFSTDADSDFQDVINACIENRVPFVVGEMTLHEQFGTPALHLAIIKDRMLSLRKSNDELSLLRDRLSTMMSKRED